MSRVLFAFCLMIFASVAAAQDAAVLVADEIELTREDKLVARGNVEAFQNGQTLRATQVEYDRATGILTITGPIVFDDGQNTVILADQAEIDEDFANGLLKGARIVIDQQLQLTSVEMNRVGGRYNQLYRVAATACRICENDPSPPLWQIRARKVIHDTEERQLYFHDAQLRILGIPVFYLPRLRMPDPTVERATGFLIPSLQTTSQLGTGIKIPYFIVIDDHRDITLTPYLSGNTETLEFRYRQRWSNGGINVNGAVSRDDILPGQDRGYLFAQGGFVLQRGYVLSFDLELTSDDTYLSQYNYSGKDRLDSELRLSRVRRDQYVAARLISLQSLRGDEDNDTIPSRVLELAYEQRYFPSAVGGELRFSTLTHLHERTSNSRFDGPDEDDVVDGRDVFRTRAQVDWRRLWTVGPGLRVQSEVGVFGDLISLSQDPEFPDTEAGVAPFAAVEFRYPMVKRQANGAVTHIEPVMQIAWTGGNDLDVPNEESTRPEFDEGNLLALSRFSASDRRERGRVMAYGMSWSRRDPRGWDAALTLGQVLRADADDDFTETSGLTGTSSDFLVAGELRINPGFNLTGRAIFDGQFDLAKSEFRGDWRYKRLALAGSYIFLTDDPDEERDAENGEFNIVGTYALDKHWSFRAGTRYDFEDRRTANANLGIVYENECVKVDFTWARDYASSASIEPTTNVGFSVALTGFAARAAGKHISRSCEGRTF